MSCSVYLPVFSLSQLNCRAQHLLLFSSDVMCGKAGAAHLPLFPHHLHLETGDTREIHGRVMGDRVGMTLTHFQY